MSFNGLRGGFGRRHAGLVRKRTAEPLETFVMGKGLS